MNLITLPLAEHEGNAVFRAEDFVNARDFPRRICAGTGIELLANTQVKTIDGYFLIDPTFSAEKVRDLVLEALKEDN